MSCRLFLAIGLFAGVSLGSTMIRAQSAVAPGSQESTSPESVEPRQRAKQLYEEGLAAYRGGQHSDAIDKLLEADRVMPNAAFSYNIALVYEAMGDMRSALRWLRGYLRQKGDNPDDTATRTKVRKLEAELQARGLQQVTILSKPSGATLKIDGHPAGLTPFTTELAPGTHQIAVELEAHQTAQRLLELRADRSMDVEFELEASPVASGVTPVVPAKPTDGTVVAQGPNATVSPMVEIPSAPKAIASGPPVDRVGSAPRVQVLTWISLGVGTALLGGAVYYEFARAKAEDRAAHASQDVYQSRFDAIAPLQTKARIFAVSGAVVATTGLVLLTIDITKRNSTPLASMVLGPDGRLSLDVRGRF